MEEEQTRRAVLYSTVLVTAGCLQPDPGTSGGSNEPSPDELEEQSDDQQSNDEPPEEGEEGGEEKEKPTYDESKLRAEWFPSRTIMASVGSVRENNDGITDRISPNINYEDLLDSVLEELEPRAVYVDGSPERPHLAAIDYFTEYAADVAFEYLRLNHVEDGEGREIETSDYGRWLCYPDPSLETIPYDGFSDSIDFVGVTLASNGLFFGFIDSSRYGDPFGSVQDQIAAGGQRGRYQDDAFSPEIIHYADEHRDHDYEIIEPFLTTSDPMYIEAGVNASPEDVEDALTKSIDPSAEPFGFVTSDIQFPESEFDHLHIPVDQYNGMSFRVREGTNTLGEIIANKPPTGGVNIVEVYVFDSPQDAVQAAQKIYHRSITPASHYTERHTESLYTETVVHDDFYELVLNTTYILTGNLIIIR